MANLRGSLGLQDRDNIIELKYDFIQAAQAGANPLKFALTNLLRSENAEVKEFAEQMYGDTEKTAILNHLVGLRIEIKNEKSSSRGRYSQASNSIVIYTKDLKRQFTI